MAAATLAILVSLQGARGLSKKIETDLFADPIVYSITSPYQKLTLTHQEGNDTRLYEWCTAIFIVG